MNLNFKIDSIYKAIQLKIAQYK